MKYLTAIVKGTVEKIKQHGKLKIVVLKQGDYRAYVNLGSNVPEPKVLEEVTYQGTVKLDEYNGKSYIHYWANELLTIGE